MDKRLQEIMDHIEEMKIGLDDTFKFHCTECGKCCTEREDILLSPLDVYNMAKELNMTPEDMVRTYCEWYIGESSRMPIVRIKPRGTIRRCPLMKDRKCSVHRAKPAVCAMFPLGRSIMIGKEKFSPEAVKNAKTQYILNDIHCGDDSETHTVRSYLEAFGIPVEDWFFHEWQSMVCELGNFIHKAEKKLSEKAMSQLWMTIFLVMYLSYDTNSGFEPQFMENKTKLLELIHMLPIAA